MIWTRPKRIGLIQNDHFGPIEGQGIKRPFDNRFITSDFDDSIGNFKNLQHT
jgi:hypothetical protein